MPWHAALRVVDGNLLHVADFHRLSQFVHHFQLDRTPARRDGWNGLSLV
jgi:hypothetical protein